MKKKLLYVSPILSRSGYGDHAREFAQFLLEHTHEYDIHLIATPWGHNPQTGLKEKTELHSQLSTMFVDKSDVHDFYDIYVQMGLPPEFKRLGTYNVGITAGVETSKVNAPFIKGCNQMDTVIVPSEFTKSTFENSTTDSLKLTTDIQVVHEYANDSFYINTESTTTNDVTPQLDAIKEDFCFLFMGQWTSSPTDDGGRKNIRSLINTFVNAFNSHEEKPALVLKTNGTDFSTSDYYDTQERIQEVLSDYKEQYRPPVYLLHGEIDSDELHYLYTHKKIKAFVTHTRGEGFGRPLLEATLCAVPVIAPNWSGHLDFLSKEYSTLLNYAPKPVGVTNELFCKESTWADVVESDSAKELRTIYESYDRYNEGAIKLKEINRSEFSKKSAFAKYNQILIPKFEKVSVEVPINLPDIN